MGKTLQSHRFVLQQSQGLGLQPGSSCTWLWTAPSPISLRDSQIFSIFCRTFSQQLHSQKIILLLFIEKKHTQGNSIYLTTSLSKLSLQKYVYRNACPYHWYANHNKWNCPNTVVILNLLCLPENPQSLAYGVHPHSFNYLQLDLDGYH